MSYFKEIDGKGWPDGGKLGQGGGRRREGDLKSGERKKARERLMRERPHCHWCGRDLRKNPTDDWEAYPNNRPTIEHIIPLSKGGTSAYENLALACFGCNR